MLIKLNKKVHFLFKRFLSLRKITKKKKIYKTKQLIINNLIRSKRRYRFSTTILNRKFLFISKYLHKFKLQIYIKVCQNNIFCTLKNVYNNKILLNLSCGMLKLDTSKKKLNYNLKFILETFFKNANSYLKVNKNFIIQIISAKKFRKKILNLLKYKFKKKNVILRTKKNKCFNGCRPSKKKRKKRVVLKVSI